MKIRLRNNKNPLLDMDFYIFNSFKSQFRNFDFIFFRLKKCYFAEMVRFVHYGTNVAIITQICPIWDRFVHFWPFLVNLQILPDIGFGDFAISERWISPFQIHSMIKE